MSFFELEADYDLNLMRPNQTLNGLTSDILLGLKPILEEFQPDYVYVHGDTTTTMASALAAFYSGAKICHVEAGLRTYNLQSPFPEEMNRQVTGIISILILLRPRFSSKFIEEGKKKVDFVTGNTVIDALMYGIEKVKSSSFEDQEIKNLEKIIDTDKKLILVIRRENHGEGFIRICESLKHIAEQTQRFKLFIRTFKSKCKRAGL